MRSNNAALTTDSPHFAIYVNILYIKIPILIIYNFFIKAKTFTFAKYTAFGLI